jgi:CO dehydrogenase nickel-insertion accessory protein CooC1
MRNMAIKARIEIYFVLSKIDEKTLETMTSNVDPKKVVAAIPQNHNMVMSNLEGKKLKTSFQEIDPRCQLIENFKKNFPYP